jgi:glycerophosphoryl diester phosphodiesterase
MPIKPRSPQSVQIIGHRGSAAPFPENTLEAILYGIFSGARMIEVDLRLSKDQEVILSHDENLSKITGSNQNISEKTWEELSQLEIRKKKEVFHLARLKDVFKCIPRDIEFYLELKGSRSLLSDRDKKLADKVISIIKKEKMKKQCLIMSFNQNIAQYMKNTYPSYRAGIIFNSRARLNTFAKKTEKNSNIKFDCLAINHKLLTKRSLQTIWNSRIPFVVWTVNNKKLWEKMVSCRPSGIVTDYPEKFSGMN